MELKNVQVSTSPTARDMLTNEAGAFGEAVLPPPPFTEQETLVREYGPFSVRVKVYAPGERSNARLFGVESLSVPSSKSVKSPGPFTDVEKSIAWSDSGDDCVMITIRPGCGETDVIERLCVPLPTLEPEMRV